MQPAVLRATILFLSAFSEGQSILDVLWPSRSGVRGSREENAISVL